MPKLYAVDIFGAKELERSLKKLGNAPQKSVNYSARKAANIGKKAARTLAPEDTGKLKKGIVLKGEKSKYKGKKVYQVTFDAKMNGVFQKKSKSGKISYYPASQEYGYFARNGRYIPGYHFMQQAASTKAAEMDKTMVSELTKEVEKALKG